MGNAYTRAFAINNYFLPISAVFLPIFGPIIRDLLIILGPWAKFWAGPWPDPSLLPPYYSWTTYFCQIFRFIEIGFGCAD